MNNIEFDTTELEKLINNFDKLIDSQEKAKESASEKGAEKLLNLEKKECPVLTGETKSKLTKEKKDGEYKVICNTKQGVIQNFGTKYTRKHNGWFLDTPQKYSDDIKKTMSDAYIETISKNNI